MPEPHTDATGHCSVDGCPATYKTHRWGQIDADRKGWFFSKAEDKAYCPRHVPGWVAEWRAKKGR